MPALRAEEAHVADLCLLLTRYPHLRHLRVRRRADVLTLESGPKDDPIDHVRFRRVTIHLWNAEVASHTGRWQPSGLRGRLDILLQSFVNDFSWTLMPIV